MISGRFRFGRFLLDTHDRLLFCDDSPVGLNARYLDALVLLVSEHGRLVSKSRFHDDVWRGIPVTDEALTQCIRTLRRQLGDDAANPRFIETVPKHGYRFIAPVEAAGQPAISVADKPAATPRPAIMCASAGTLGGGVAGVIGGTAYGLAAAAQPPGAGMGAISALLVLAAITTLVALIGAAGVSAGIAVAGALARGRDWAVIVGGALGGWVIGGLVKLLGLDAFTLLFGQSPGDITGAIEGLVLGAAVGLGVWFAERGRASVRRSLVAGGVAGAAGGAVVTLVGGKLMAGSLDLLARHFADSRLRLDTIGHIFGERAFGPISSVVTGVTEGALFGACIVGARALARRR